jgi:hypothetical protein
MILVDMIGRATTKIEASKIECSTFHFIQHQLTDEGLECSGRDGGLDDVSHLETGL